MRNTFAFFGIIGAVTVAAAYVCQTISTDALNTINSNEADRVNQHYGGCDSQSVSHDLFHRNIFYTTYSNNGRWAAASTYALLRNQFHLYDLDKQIYLIITDPNPHMLLTDYTFDPEGHYLAFAATISGNFGVTEIYSIQLNDLSIRRHLQGMYRNPLVNTSGDLVAVLQARSSFAPRTFTFAQAASHSPLSFFINISQPLLGYAARFDNDRGPVNFIMDPDIPSLNHLQEASLADRLSFNQDGQIIFSIPYYSYQATNFSRVRGHPGYPFDRAYRVTMSSDYSSYTVQMFLGQEHEMRPPPPQWAENVEPANEVCLQSDLAQWRF